MATRGRIVMFGTPAFAVPALEALCDEHEVLALVCQPDRPSGRGNVLTAPPTKVAALARGILVHQPEKVKDGALAAWLRALAPDLAVVVAYGRILPLEVLTAPRLGCVNVHASVLPRWRGASPIQHAVLAGDTETGVTLMQMDVGMDTGALLSIRRTTIGPDETAEALGERLSALGAQMLREDLGHVLEGALTPVPQDEAHATHAPMLSRDQGRLQWNRPARELHNQVRGLQPWPGASTTLGARRLIVNATRLDGAPVVYAGAPGEVVAITRDRLWVATREGLLGLTELQLEGKKRMGVKEFCAGHPLRTGTLLGGAS
ncbi:MAG: methionyl-tRNA formyltransferase [Deltaproteobacteria bacterium]|nr:methionyl-tRNA formyltransferase [Deltaproteobacteria bacterium]